MPAQHIAFSVLQKAFNRPNVRSGMMIVFSWYGLCEVSGAFLIAREAVNDGGVLLATFMVVSGAVTFASVYGCWRNRQWSGAALLILSTCILLANAMVLGNLGLLTTRAGWLVVFPIVVWGVAYRFYRLETGTALGTPLEGRRVEINESFQPLQKQAVSRRWPLKGNSNGLRKS